MEAISSSETSVTTHKTIRRHNPVDHDLTWTISYCRRSLFFCTNLVVKTIVKKCVKTRLVKLLFLLLSYFAWLVVYFGVMTGYGLDDRGSILSRSRVFLSSPFLTSSGALSPLSSRFRGSFLGCETGRSSPYKAEFRNKRSFTCSPPPPKKFSWYGLS
jgi:hypothetical protein